MRIGIFIGSHGAPSDLDGRVRQVVAAERDGFDSFWAAQVLGVDALTLIALAGQRTRRIEMGTAPEPALIRPRRTKGRGPGGWSSALGGFSTPLVI